MTGYQVLYESNEMESSTITVDSETTSVLISNLQSGENYRVSAIALSYFPSLETDPVDIFLCKYK